MMNILRTFLIIILATPMISCESKEQVFDGKVKISGKIENSETSNLTLIKYLDNSTEVVDTLKANSNGKFEYELELDEPGFYEINIQEKGSIMLALYDQDVTVNYDVKDEKSLSIEGSVDSQNMQKVKKLREDYQDQINNLNDAYYEAMSNKDQEKIKSIQEEAMNLEGNHSNKVKETINEMGDSFASLFALGMLNPKQEFIFMDELVGKLNDKYPNTKMITSLMAQLEDLRALSIGQEAPEISLPNPEGNIVSLSDLRGKYVLIDFWAAWCKPCREENPNVVRLYNEYKDKGFEVFGVSLDRTKEAWEKAIAEDELTWTHVSDLKYFNSEAAAKYQINAIPATYLIDPDGKIVAKDLRGMSLENKLAEIFN